MTDQNARREAEIKPLWLKAKPGHNAQKIRASMSLEFKSADDLPDYVWDLIDIAAERGIRLRAAPDASDLERAIYAYYGEEIDQNDIDPDNSDAAAIERIAAAFAETRQKAETDDRLERDKILYQEGREGGRRAAVEQCAQWHDEKADLAKRRAANHKVLENQRAMSLATAIEAEHRAAASHFRALASTAKEPQQ